MVRHAIPLEGGHGACHDPNKRLDAIGSTCALALLKAGGRQKMFTGNTV